MKVFIVEAPENTSKLSGVLFSRIFQKIYHKKVDYDKLLRDKNGKPFPIDDICFNVSHSGNYWCVAFSEHPCGIDIECRHRKINGRLATRILSVDDDLGAGDSLLEVWTLKEAFSKMDGRGIGIDFTKIPTRRILENYIVVDLCHKDYVCYVVGTEGVEIIVDMYWDGRNLISRMRRTA